VEGVNTFSGSPVDRAGARRTDARWVAEQLADPRSRAILVIDDGVAVEDGRLARVPLAPAHRREPILLGIEHGAGALFAVDASGTEPPPGTTAVGLRDAAATLSHADAGLVAQATGLVNWHRRHPRCAVCGERTEVAEAGYLRRCPNCGAQHHPRTDPVVIMLVTDGDRALLGRQARWPPGRYSALAGFVEPGESLEEAVAREVLEEAGVEVGAVRYMSSQPWPFPTSLMIGCHAEALSREIIVDREELDDARWFEREEVAFMLARQHPDGFTAPQPVAIAYHIIRAWVEDGVVFE
jgi:NAD+ diphosphatase